MCHIISITMLKCGLKQLKNVAENPLLKGLLRHELQRAPEKQSCVSRFVLFIYKQGHILKHFDLNVPCHPGSVLPKPEKPWCFA